MSASSENPKKPGEMSFFDHLDELRGVLFACIGVVLGLTIAAWFISGTLLDFIVKITVQDAQFIKPHEAFLTRFKLAFVVGLLIGLPFVAYKIWSFVVPGLLKKEKTIVFPLVFWSTALFLIGVSFSVFVLTPVMLKFLSSFETNVVQSKLAVGYLFDFYAKISFACGILFQLPLVIAVLSFFGIVTPQLLRSIWRQAIVGILILAAVVTPADVLSQLMLGVPIVLLYFISIIISAAIQKSKRKNEPEYDVVSTEDESTSSPGATGAEVINDAARNGEEQAAAEIRQPDEEQVPYEPLDEAMDERPSETTDGEQESESDTVPGDTSPAGADVDTDGDVDDDDGADVDTDDDVDDDAVGADASDDSESDSPAETAKDSVTPTPPLKPPPDDWSI